MSKFFGPTLILLTVFLFAPKSQAAFTELGLSFNYKKVNFDDYNNVESQGITGSVAFYAWERVGFEFAYTNSLMVKKELQLPTPGSTSLRTTTQKADIYELNTQFLLAPDRKAVFQPYIKGGIAFIKKRQQVQIDSGFPYEISPTPGLGPGIGIGAKIFLSETLSLRISYDVMRTPIDNGLTADDLTGRAGISWML